MQQPDNRVQPTTGQQGQEPNKNVQSGPRPLTGFRAGGQVVIKVDNLVKQFGRVRALNGLSLSVEKSEIFGLLGQNGAGKTTLVKILLGILKPTEGGALLLGEPVGQVAARRRIGYLPEDHRFPEYHTGASLLDFYGDLLEMPRGKKKQRIPEVLELVGLKGRMNYKIRTYSKGMKQRLGIAQAIIHEPEVLFLDEPTDGVDPVGRREIRQMMQELKDRGVTIFLNSHLLGEVELICDRAMILDRGEPVRYGTISELTQKKGTFVIGLADGQGFPAAEVKELGYSAVQKQLFWEVDLTEGQTIDPVVDLIRQKGLALRHLVEKRQTLEDLFVETVEAVEPGLDARGPRRVREVGGSRPRERDRGRDRDWDRDRR